jgi:nicotinamide-nucleotide amidase
MATEMAAIVRQQAGATHGLAVLVDVDPGPDRNDLGGTICLAVAAAHEVATRCSRIAGGREWVRLGATEMGLDSLRRYLRGLPVDQRIDFERTAEKP